MSRKTVGVGFFGKVRIPTIGHKAAIDTAKSISSKVGGQLHVALSGASHPLSVSQKKAHAEALFQHPIETHHQTVIEFLHNMSKLHDDFTLVCGSDRAREYHQLISRYNGNKDRSGKIPFSFRKWRVHEIAGKRVESTKNPTRMSQDELVRSVSASKLEKLAKEDKYDHFLAYHPGMKETQVKRLYNQIRRGLSLHESVPKLSLSLHREQMPQIPKDKIEGFISHLKKNHVDSEKTKVDTKDLKASQSTFDMDKVFDIMMNDTNNPIIVSKDDHVLDGHHRWLAKHGEKIDALKIDLPILDLIRTAKEYENTLNEATEKWEMDGLIDKFSSFVCSKLGISKKPPIIRMEDGDRSFGGYHPGDKTIHIVTKNRHPMDVFRTLAHELVHHKQDLDGRIKDVASEGKTGSPIEDEANYMAGRIMRWWAKTNPGHFALGSLTENVAIFVVGGPCSGKDKVVKQLKESLDIKEVDLMSMTIVYDKMIVNGSADKYDEIVKAKALLEENGYHTSLIFVDTSNEISKLRNEQRKNRGQRILSENVRFAKYEQSQQNKERFHELFGEDMKEITNNINEGTSRSGKVVATEYTNKKAYFTQMGDGYWSIYTKPNGAGEEIKGDFRTLRLARQWWEKNKRLKENVIINPTLNTVSGSVGEIPEKNGTKVTRKKKKQQDSQNDFSTEGSGVGATVGGHGKVQKPYGLAEWANDPRTITRFEKKYGISAQQKLSETVKKLSEGVSDRSNYRPKTIKQIRESIDKGVFDSGTVPKQSNPDDPLPETGKIYIRSKTNKGTKKHK